MSIIDTAAAFGKVKSFLSNFVHGCEAELAHIEQELGIALAPEPAPTPEPVVVPEPIPALEPVAPVSEPDPIVAPEPASETTTPAAK